MKQVVTKPDYSLAIRYMKRDGQWSDWMDRGKGKFISIELVQKQIRMIASVYQNREKQIRFEKNGCLCDWFGNETGCVIDLK
jgi:hypothetical protein